MPSSRDGCNNVNISEFSHLVSLLSKNYHSFLLLSNIEAPDNSRVKKPNDNLRKLVIMLTFQYEIEVKAH